MEWQRLESAVMVAVGADIKSMRSAKEHAEGQMARRMASNLDQIFSHRKTVAELALEGWKYFCYKIDPSIKVKLK